MLISPNIKDIMKQQAIAVLMNEIKKDRDSVKSDNDWISEEDLLAEFGIDI